MICLYDETMSNLLILFFFLSDAFVKCFQESKQIVPVSLIISRKQLLQCKLLFQHKAS